MTMTSTEHSQRLRERRKKEGDEQVTLWLSPPLLRQSEAISEGSGQPLNKVLLSAVEFGLGIARDQLVSKDSSESNNSFSK